MLKQAIFRNPTADMNFSPSFTPNTSSGYEYSPKVNREHSMGVQSMKKCFLCNSHPKQADGIHSMWL